MRDDPEEPEIGKHQRELESMLRILGLDARQDDMLGELFQESGFALFKNPTPGVERYHVMSREASLRHSWVADPGLAPEELKQWMRRAAGVLS